MKAKKILRVIIGASIYGAFCALKQTEFDDSFLGSTIVFYKEKSKDAIENNTAILHSGIHFFYKKYKNDEFPSNLFKRLNESFNSMLDFAGSQSIDEISIVDVTNLDIGEFELAINENNLESKVFKVKDNDARNYLGTRYEAGHTYFYVPDRVVDFDHIVNGVNKLSSQRNVLFIPIKNLELLNHKGQILILADEELYEPYQTILAAGNSNHTLLKQIGIIEKGLNCERMFHYKLGSQKELGLRAKLYYKFTEINGSIYPSSHYIYHSNEATTTTNDELVVGTGHGYSTNTDVKELIDRDLIKLRKIYPNEISSLANHDNAHFCDMTYNQERYKPLLEGYFGDKVLVGNVALASYGFAGAVHTTNRIWVLPRNFNYKEFKDLIKTLQQKHKIPKYKLWTRK